MSTLGTYYLNAPSLGSATSVYTDAALTTVAPDGWYTDGTTVRLLDGGVFDIPMSCPACIEKCSSAGISYLGTRGYFYTEIDTGTTSVDVGAIVIEVTLGTSHQIPLGIVFTLFGNVYNKFSCQNFGLISIPSSNYIYIGNSADNCGIVGLGPVSLPVNEYNPVTNTYDNTGQTLTYQATAPQLALTAGNPGKFVMVIPKNIAAPYGVLYIILSLCNTYPTEFNVVVNCPANLPSFTSTENCATDTDTCLLPTTQTYYSADVNGNTSSGGFLGLYDWVFYDSFGQTVLPDGFYRSPSVNNPDSWFEVQDGVIISFGGCGSVVQRNINYDVQNTISGSCSTNVNDLRLKISQPPTSPYIDSLAPSSGTTAVPEGITHAQLILDWTNTVTGCGQVRMVIEKDSVIIASKIFQPSTGIDYLDVDFTLNADCNIYAYVTLL